MSGGGYNETILLDCNRLSSEEFSASSLAIHDTAIFTNRVSSGLTLNIGDQVSIQSAHIAQRGAGGSVIEFKGADIGSRKNISYTETTNASHFGFDFQFAGVAGGAQICPTGFAYETSETVTEMLRTRDNEASIVIDYHITANGENVISMPRNYGNASIGHNASGLQGYNGSGTNYKDGMVMNASYWGQYDGYVLGAITYPVSASHIFEGDFVHSPGTLSSSGTLGVNRIWKVKQDNTRFTLFKMKEIVWEYGRVSSASNASWLKPNHPLAPDPACHALIRFKQKVNLSVPIGYNSPSNIASNITNELLETEQPKPYAFNSSPAMIVDSAVNKAIPCANYTTFNNDTNKDFFDSTLNASNINIGVGASSVVSRLSSLHLANYGYIGFKRPDFVETGRGAFAYHGNKLTAEIALANASTAIIYTNITYSEAVVKRIANLFDVEKNLCSDLLDGGLSEGRTNYTTTFNSTSGSLSASFRDEARFLHIGLATSGLGDYEALGSDMYNVSHTARANASDLTTAPLFIYFNKNCSHLTTNDTVADNLDNLAYGFAINNGGLIAFTTERIGGIPTSYFKEQASDKIDTGTKIGYDHHFFGYGNAALMPSSGYFPLQYFGHQRFTLTELVRNVYVGADNPLFNFDTVESRFTFSNLHTAEKVGNFYNAGDPQQADTVFSPPSSGEAGNDCYKINKQLHYTSWSPSMFPYSLITIKGNASLNNQQSFISLNDQLMASVIYDSHSGIAIRDMGVEEEFWDKSLWGILGFEYGQFNASGSNIQNANTIRYTDNTTNSSGITTNANVTSTDSVNYLVNAFASNLFKPMINSDVEYYNSSKVMGTSRGDADYELQPPSVIDATSTVIKANRLPRKILRGYFLINSDLLDEANYLQTANPMRTMAMVGKYSAAEDFVNYDGGGAVFTITRKKTITDIKTQILDPEGTTAQIGDNSGVIYRIDKQIQTDLRFAETLMSQSQSK